MYMKKMIDLLESGLGIKLIPTKTHTTLCPNCNEKILKYSLIEDEPYHETYPNLDKGGFIYKNGYILTDIIPLKSNQFHCELLQGECLVCKKKYLGVELVIVSNPVSDKFFVHDEDICYSDEIDSELYTIKISNNIIGSLAVHKNVKDNDNNCNIYVFHLEHFEFDNEISTSTEEEGSLLKNAMKLVPLIINDFIKNSEFRIEEV